MDPVTITPLSDQLDSFPHFMPNQVLTHTQLNQLAFYLEQQDRFTRQRLIGIGIVCGLQADLIVSGSTRTVEISKGVGVTSCGFLIDVPEILSFGKKKSYTTPADYEPFNINTLPTPTITCIELKPVDSTESGVSNLTNADVTNKVVVLFLDIEDKPNGKCLGENCDEKGNKWVFTLRVLLIDKGDADKILKKAYAPNVFNNPLNSSTQREDFFNPEYRLFPVFVERFGNTTNNANTDFNLSLIQSYATFEDTYINIIEKSSVRVARAIHEAYRLFKLIFDTQLLTTSNPFAGFDGATSASNSLTLTLLAQLQKGNCQYIFDFVRDLADTYNELRDELSALASECSPDPSKFPRHLMLGELKNVDFGRFEPTDYAPPTVYRTHFLSSPAIDGQSRHLKKAKMLISRLVVMLESLDFTNLLTDDIEEEPIRIIPDKLCCSALSEQRIPFYYNYEGTVKLSSYWNFKLTILNRSFENRSYFASAYVPGSLPADFATSLVSPQLFDIRNFSKLGIEGHVGKDLQTAVDELKALRRRYNLSFDILALKLDSDLNQVLLAEDNLIADLQSQYLADRNEIVCCLRELRAYVEEHKNTIALMLAYMVVIILVAMDNTTDASVILSLLYPIIIDLLDAYVAALDVMIAALRPDIKSFNFQDLAAGFPVVDNFTRTMKYIINTWGDIEFLFLQQRDGQANNVLWALSDIVSIYLNYFEMYLDKIGDDCLLGKFYSIYTVFQARIRTFCLFDQFNTRIHGMEHIAGTVQGGTFILVYEDDDEVNEFSGEVFDAMGNPLEMAYIVNAENETIVYGTTDNKGAYRVNIPAREKSFRIVKPGYVADEVKTTRAKAKKVNLHSYMDEAPAAKKVSEKPLRKVDTAYMKIKYSVGEITSVDKKFEKVSDYVNLEVAAVAEKAFVIEPKESFRVVADFYLPHLIHNYKTAVDPIDACDDFKEVNVLDFDNISAALDSEVKARTKGTKGGLFSAYEYASSKK